MSSIATECKWLLVVSVHYYSLTSSSIALNHLATEGGGTQTAYSSYRIPPYISMDKHIGIQES